MSYNQKYRLYTKYGLPVHHHPGEMNQLWSHAISNMGSIQKTVISSLLGTQQNNIKVDAMLKVTEVVVAEQTWKKWITS